MCMSRGVERVAVGWKCETCMMKMSNYIILEHPLHKAVKPSSE